MGLGSKYIAALIRSLLQLGAGYLVAAGIVEESLVAPFVDATTALLVAVSMWAISLAWSLAEKKAKTIWLVK